MELPDFPASLLEYDAEESVDDAVSSLCEQYDHIDSQSPSNCTVSPFLVATGSR